MRILVTGGGGFIGSNLVDKLVCKGHKVIVIDNLSTGKIENINTDSKFLKADLLDNDISNIIKHEKPEIVFHMAAQSNVNISLINPVEDAKCNIIGTINLLESCIKNNVRKIIYSSSAAIYGNPEYLSMDENHRNIPISFYGISKLTPEYYIDVYNKIYGLKYTILRYSNVYGIRQNKKSESGVISIFLDNVLNDKNPIIFGDGKNERDYIYVEDVIDANISSIYNGDNEIINIGTGKATSVIDLLNKINIILGTNIKPIFEAERKGDIKYSYFNIEKAIDVLNWKPKYNLLEGLEKTINFTKVKEK